MKLILSESGGGFMGIGPSLYLASVEGYLDPGRPLGKTIDLFVGTSVGAIDMALLACGVPAKGVYALHKEHGPGIFAKENWAYKLLKNGPRFDDGYVNQLLRDRLGSVTMDKTQKPLYITAWDARKKDIKVFGPGDIGVPVWYAVRCSMAASTYFSPMKGFRVDDSGFHLTQDYRYVDGGFAANDPTLVGIAAAIGSQGWAQESLKVVSLITSGKNPEAGTLNPSWNVLTTLNKIVIPAVTSGNSSDVEFISNAWLGEERLFRVRPDCPEFGLADVSESDRVEGIWHKQFGKDYGKLIPFLRRNP